MPAQKDIAAIGARASRIDLNITQNRNKFFAPLRLCELKTITIDQNLLTTVC